HKSTSGSNCFVTFILPEGALFVYQLFAEQSIILNLKQKRNPVSTEFLFCYLTEFCPSLSIRTPSVPRPISFYALAGRDPEPNTTIRKEEATWSRTSSCRCGSEQFIQKENFPAFTYRLFVLWNRVIYTKLLTHPFHYLLL